MHSRVNIATGAPWEDSFGYSRAVRIGNLIEVSGTAAIDRDGQVIGKNDPYRQCRFILAKIEKALEMVGATMADVIRTRIYVTNMNDWEQISRAHSEFFKDIKPATTLVEVSSFILPEFLVEVEATAFILTSE